MSKGRCSVYWSSTRNAYALLKAVIIEDEEDARKLLSKMLEEFIPGIDVVGIVGGVNEGTALLEHTKADIVFLDIELEDGNAFELLTGHKYKDFQLIFTTAYQEHAHKAFKEEAVDYLLKPYSPTELIEAVNRARKRINEGSLDQKLDVLASKLARKEKSKLRISTSDGIDFVPIDEIIRVEADRTYCVIHSKRRSSIVVSRPLKEIEGGLPVGLFFRCHSGHLINVNHVSRFDRSEGGSIVMSDGSIVPLARRRREEFFIIIDEGL